MTAQEYLSFIKTKKIQSLSIQGNHPHRLSSVSISGSATFVEDGRSFTSPGLSAFVYTHHLDTSGMREYYRYLWGNYFPVYDSGNFLLSSTTLMPWLFLYGLDSEIPMLTDCYNLNTKYYTRNTLTDPWNLISDVDSEFDASFSLTISGGGSPDSGGYDDTASGDALIQVQINTNNAGLPLELNGSFYRDPYVDAWASESDVFADDLSDQVAAGNAAQGGGYSGSSSITITFS
jgi:hypothetical protein